MADILYRIREASRLNEEGHTSTHQIFGESNFSEYQDDDIIAWWDDNSMQGEFQEFANKTNMPNILQEIYYMIRNSSKELVLGAQNPCTAPYTVMSLLQMMQGYGKIKYIHDDVCDKHYKLELLNIMLDEPNMSFCDFATRYHGMGHREVLSWRISDGKCFKRISGGAEAWGHLFSHNDAALMDPDANDMIHKTISAEELLKRILDNPSDLMIENSNAK